MRETWRIIPGYPDYEVSDLGRVRSYRRGGTPHILKPAKNVRNGYRYLTVVSDEGKPWSIQVHRLVLLAFVGPKPVGMESRHLDGDAENNALSNLEYATHLVNIHDIRRHGRRLGGPIGRKGPRILTLAPGEMTAAVAAATLGVAPNRFGIYCKTGLIKARKQQGAWVVHESNLTGFTPPKRGRPTNSSRLERAA